MGGTTTAAPNYRAVAAQAAARYGINPAIFLRQIQQESGFNPNARSSAGAVGIAQIVPHWHPGVDATDPIASLNYAAKYMATLVHKYGGYAQALSVYNSGNPNAYKDPSFAKGQTYNYVRDILGGSNPAAPHVAPSLTAPLAALGTSPSAGGVSPQLLSAMHSMDSMLGIQPLSMPTALPTPSLSLNTPPSLTSSPFRAPTGFAALNGNASMAFGGHSPYSNIRFAGNVDWEHVDPKLLRAINAAASKRGVMVTVNSGYRSNQHSRAVGGFAGDPHTKGLAVDAYIDGKPIGDVIPPSIWNTFGVTSGATPGFYKGTSDPEHLQIG